MFKFKRLSRSLYFVTSALILMGCQSSMPPLTTAIKPPADLVQPCPNLPKLEGGTGADVLPWSLQVVSLYNDCKARHKALSDTLR
ncbi:Rz1-like lysis system protein LysC [Neisseria subflava]|uniref:Rz1-like lysis system protein LysC n=1 Tax=Neisseria subflava TaxID=28449 RepID=UPI00403EAF8A